ncbi:PREDICTED: uncharacterized protein LOC105562375 [Vollenhovia emeryi]|uniref:uncharacterized protein LOC105562375 n=1 Tax=Vollenhovia emeryi TaxID=411798 RepID=UPI0005F5589D|nr:PREDICTED: uncharacterized protein LOC105562375 [Vollenhovia emeryi]
MSFKIACYFGWIAIDLRIIFSTMLINNYMKTNKYICAVLHFVWLAHNVLKSLLINYMCETVSTKANKTGDLLNRLFYFDVEVYEIISQFSLHIVYAPLRFCGIGFFQFGFQFLHRGLLKEAYYCGQYIRKTWNNNKLPQTVYEDGMARLELDYNGDIINLYRGSMVSR